MFDDAPLRQDQVRQFLDEGYVLASDLIPKDVAAKADAAAWRLNGLHPEEPGQWHTAAGKPEFFDDADLMAVYTQRFLAAAAQLCPNPYLCGRHRAPESAFVIKLLPTAGPWKVVDEHVDGSYENPPLLAFPQQWHLFAMIYLHDVEPHGGGTVLRPSSSKVIESLVRSNPKRFKFLREIRPLIPELKTQAPIELQPRAGDVLFFHPWTIHSKPMNTGKRPRFAMNCKF